MTNPNNAPLDFDPSANYVAEVKAENSLENESTAETGAESESLELFEADTLQSVRVANESAEPTPQESEAIAEIRAELGLVDETNSATAESAQENRERVSLATERARELLLSDTLTSSETDSPLPLEEILANQGERGALEEELFTKMLQGEIDDNEKALLLNSVAAKAKWLTPTGVVRNTALRGNADIKAAVLKGIGDDSSRALDRKIVESWE